MKFMTTGPQLSNNT